MTISLGGMSAASQVLSPVKALPMVGLGVLLLAGCQTPHAFPVWSFEPEPAGLVLSAEAIGAGGDSRGEWHASTSVQVLRLISVSDGEARRYELEFRFDLASVSGVRFNDAGTRSLRVALKGMVLSLADGSVCGEARVLGPPQRPVVPGARASIRVRIPLARGLVPDGELLAELSLAWRLQIGERSIPLVSTFRGLRHGPALLGQPLKGRRWTEAGPRTSSASTEVLRPPVAGARSLG